MMGTKAEGLGLSKVSSLGYRSHRGARTPASGEVCGLAGQRPVRRRGSLPRPRGHLGQLLQLQVPGWDSKGSMPFHLAPSRRLTNAVPLSTCPSVFTPLCGCQHFHAFVLFHLCRGRGHSHWLAGPGPPHVAICPAWGCRGVGHHMQREGGMLGANTASDKWPQEARGPPERSLAWLLLPCSTDSDQAFAWPGSQPQEPISLYGGGAHTQLSVLSSQEPPPPGSPRCRAAPLPASTLLLTGQRLRGLPLLWLCAAGAVLGPLPNRRGGGVH